LGKDTTAGADTGGGAAAGGDDSVSLRNDDGMSRCADAAVSIGTDGAFARGATLGSGDTGGAGVGASGLAAGLRCRASTNKASS
jgi:hypothetical protein